MASVDPETVEKYQKLYEKDPSSKVFAPLAEAYRQMGLTKEAEEICRAGIRQHPQFAGGRIALARLLLDKNELESAKAELEAAVRSAPENALALSLLGETFLKLRQPKEALRAYKTLLFVSPENEKAQSAVKKLESLTAPEYEEEVFSMKPLAEAIKDWDRIDLESEKSVEKDEKKERVLERILSLADAFTIRNDHGKALEALNEGERLYGPHPEIVRRLKIIHQRGLDQLVYPKSVADLEPLENRQTRRKTEKLEQLRQLLAKFQDLKKA